MTHEFVKSLQGNIGGWYGNNNEEIGHPGYNNLRSINEVLGYSTITSSNTSFETGFIDLFNVHNIYIHSSKLGNCSSIGVRGGNTIIKEVSVSSSLGYFIMDSVVAPHDEIDMRQHLFKTLHLLFENVHGNVIDLHGAHVSFSAIFVTMG